MKWYEVGKIGGIFNYDNSEDFKELINVLDPKWFTHFDANLSLSSEIAKRAIKEGEFDIASEYFKKAIEIEPYNCQYLYEYSKFLTSQNDLERSIQLLNRIIAIQRNDYAFKLLVVNYLKDNKLTEAYNNVKLIGSNTQYLISLIEQTIYNLIYVEQFQCFSNEYKTNFPNVKTRAIELMIDQLESIEDFRDVKGARAKRPKFVGDLKNLDLDENVYVHIPITDLRQYCETKFRWDIEYKIDYYLKHSNSVEARVDSIVRSYFVENYISRMNLKTGLNKQLPISSGRKKGIVLYNNDLDSLIKF